MLLRFSPFLFFAVQLRGLKLQVKQIQAYRHILDQLSQGMTGELWLEGEDGEYIQEKDVLGAH